MKLAAALVPFLLAAAGPATAQTAPVPVAPPLSAAPAPTPASPISLILIHPGVPLSRVPPPVAPAPGGTPLDQQQLQSYRSDLLSQQRGLELQGVGPATETYRSIQQQLNQLNGAGR